MASSAADAILAQTTRDDWNYFLEQYAPLEEKMVGDINSTEIIDKAADTAQMQNGVAAASLDRTIDRYGMNVNGAQRAQLDRQQSLGQAAGTAQAVNTARIDQRERNLGLASSLMQVGRGVNSSALDGMGTAASLEANRNATNAQNKAQAKANQWQTIGTLGSIAAFFL